MLYRILVFHSVKVWTIDILLQPKMQQLLMKTCPAGNYNTNLVMVDRSSIWFSHRTDLFNPINDMDGEWLCVSDHKIQPQTPLNICNRCIISDHWLVSGGTAWLYESYPLIQNVDWWVVKCYVPYVSHDQWRCLHVSATLHSRQREPRPFTCLLLMLI